MNTYTQLKEPSHRWGLNGGDDNWQHDVYNARALVEAAVHDYRATGKTQLLGVAVRATLLGAGLVTTANVNGRDDYLQAACRLWENMVRRRILEWKVE